MRIVGVDAGATSTRCLVVDEGGHILGHGLGGPSNHLVARFRKTLEMVFRMALPGEERPFLDSLYIGKAGTLRKEAVITIIKKYAKPKQLEISDDMLIAFWSASLGRPGLLVYAGTGANTYGIDEQGNEVRVGGWGYIIDDEGAGYDIGRQALKQVFRAEDGRGRPTILREKILAHFGCDTLAEIVEKVYQDGGLPRSEIAALSQLVSKAAEEGDRVAQEILAQAGRTLADTAIAALRKLGKSHQRFPVYLAGGVFRAGHWILNPFIQTLRQGAPLAEIRHPQFPPVAGAIFLALRLLNLQPNEEFLQNLKKGLREIGWLNTY